MVVSASKKFSARSLARLHMFFRKYIVHIHPRLPICSAKLSLSLSELPTPRTFWLRAILLNRRISGSFLPLVGYKI